MVSRADCASLFWAIFGQIDDLTLSKPDSGQLGMGLPARPPLAPLDIPGIFVLLGGVSTCQVKRGFYSKRTSFSFGSPALKF